MTPSGEAPGWSPIHDLGLVYLSLLYGVDVDNDPGETDVVHHKLQAWVPEEDPRRIQRILDEVMLVFISTYCDLMLETAVVSIRYSMSKSKRFAVLQDLMDIASADGMIVPDEVQFIQQIAHEWDLDQDLV